MKAQLSLGNRFWNEEEAAKFTKLGFKLAEDRHVVPYSSPYYSETGSAPKYRQACDDLLKGITRMKDFEDYLMSYGPYNVSLPDKIEAAIKITFT